MMRRVQLIKWQDFDDINDINDRINRLIARIEKDEGKVVSSKFAATHAGVCPQYVYILESDYPNKSKL